MANFVICESQNLLQYEIQRANISTITKLHKQFFKTVWRQLLSMMSIMMSSLYKNAQKRTKTHVSVQKRTNVNKVSKVCLKVTLTYVHSKLQERHNYLVFHSMHVLSSKAPNTIGPGMDPRILTRSIWIPNA